MFDLIFGLLGPWGSLAVLVAAAGAIGLFLVRVRHSGRRAERERQAREDARAVQKRDEIAEAVSGRSATENRERFGRWAPKP